MTKLIGLLAGWKGYVAAALVSAVIAGGLAASAAWQAQALKYDARIASLEAAHAEERRAAAEAQAGIIASNIDWMKRIAARLGSLEAAAWEGLENARVENERFRDDLLAGAERMWVRIDPHSIHRSAESGGTTTAGMDDEAAYARLHGSTAADLARLAADADEAARQLNLCQDREIERRKEE